MEVGWYDIGSRVGAAGVSRVTRVLKRDVVLEDGQRFNGAYSRTDSIGQLSGPTRYFTTADDPTFLSWKRASRTARAVAIVAREAERFRRAQTPDTAQAIVDAVASWTASTKGAP